MAKYLFQATYNHSGVQGLLKEGGSSRREAVRQAVESLGGTLESLYFGFGDVDVYCVVTLPSNVRPSLPRWWAMPPAPTRPV